MVSSDYRKFRALRVEGLGIDKSTIDFFGPASLYNRLKNLRKLGLLEERTGVKKSQICLAPTEKLLEELSPILCERHQGLFLR